MSVHNCNELCMCASYTEEGPVSPTQGALWGIEGVWTGFREMVVAYRGFQQEEGSLGFIFTFFIIVVKYTNVKFTIFIFLKHTLQCHYSVHDTAVEPSPPPNGGALFTLQS